MPLYDYRCSGCGHVQADIRLISERHDGPKCDVCRQEMTLVISPVKGIVKDPAVPKKNDRAL